MQRVKDQIFDSIDSQSINGSLQHEHGQVFPGDILDEFSIFAQEIGFGCGEFLINASRHNYLRPYFEQQLAGAILLIAFTLN